MGFFQYTAVDTVGTTKSGRIEAASRQAVVDQLARDSLTPIRVEEAKAPTEWQGIIDRIRHRSGRLGSAELLAFTRQLASLTRSGLTLERALSVSQQLALSQRQALFAKDVLQRVRRGVSLEDALKLSGVPLPSYYASLVRAGEASGSLSEALARLTELLEQSYQTRERLLSAMVYPIILMVTIGITLILIVTFVLPRFQALFDEAGARLPFATQVVMTVGSGLRNYGWLLFGMAALGTASLQRVLSVPERRLRLDTAWLRLRPYRETLAKADAARFARTLGMLSAGGVPLPNGFRIAVTTLHNTALIHSAETALAGVNAGKDLAEQLHRIGGFPPLLLQMVRVGLETGRLHETLIEAADILDDESRRAIERAVAVAVPLVTILMGLLVASLIGSVLVGILSINDLAG